MCKTSVPDQKFNIPLLLFRERRSHGIDEMPSGGYHKCRDGHFAADCAFFVVYIGEILPMSAPVIRIMVSAVFVWSSAAVTAPMAIPPSLCVVAII